MELANDHSLLQT